MLCVCPSCSGSEKEVFWKRGLFRKVHFPENSENPQIVENKGESDHFLEFREFRDSRDSSSEKTPFAMTPFFPCPSFARKKNPPKVKSSSEEVSLNNFRWVPDSCRREEGKSSRELFDQVRVNSVFFLVFQDFGWVFGPLIIGVR